MAMAFSSLVSTHCTSRDQDADAVPLASRFSRCCRWLYRSGTICTKDLAAQLANTNTSFSYNIIQLQLPWLTRESNSVRPGSNDGDFQTKYLPPRFKT